MKGDSMTAVEATGLGKEAAVLYWGIKQGLLENGLEDDGVVSPLAMRLTVKFTGQTLHSDVSDPKPEKNKKAKRSSS